MPYEALLLHFLRFDSTFIQSYMRLAQSLENSPSRVRVRRQGAAARILRWNRLQDSVHGTGTLCCGILRCWGHSVPRYTFVDFYLFIVLHFPDF